jgi:hypothetical protein
MTFPLETLPLGDPTGGVVYLRISSFIYQKKGILIYTPAKTSELPIPSPLSRASEQNN